MDKKILLILGVLVVLAISVITTQTVSSAPNPAPLVIGKGATCSVICNGQCPAPANGWSLSESTGTSGNGHNSDGVGGRCLTRTSNGSPIPGTERMCCYFQD
jgi:hypothetical protein